MPRALTELVHASRHAGAQAQVTIGWGRGTKLMVAASVPIVAMVAAGNFPSVAVRLASVSPNTLAKWLERGDQGERPFGGSHHCRFKPRLERASMVTSIMLRSQMMMRRLWPVGV